MDASHAATAMHTTMSALRFEDHPFLHFSYGLCHVQERNTRLALLHMSGALPSRIICHIAMSAADIPCA